MNKNNKPNIGIISGAGAIAGAHLYMKIIYRLSHSVQLDSDYPSITLHNVPFTCLDNKGVTDRMKAKTEVDEAIDQLDGTNCVMLLCNSLHPFVDKDALGNRFIDMVELTKNTVHRAALKHNSSLVLCSQSSSDDKIFGSDEHIVYASGTLANHTKDIISCVLKGELTHSAQWQYFGHIRDFMQEQFLDHLVIGCTELCALDWIEYASDYRDTIIVDCGELAIEELCRRFTKI